MSEKPKSPFYVDTMIYARHLSASCAHTIPKIINKKEQLAIGIIYTSLLVEKLAIHYDIFTEEKRKQFKHFFLPADFYINNFLVPTNIPLDVDKSYTQEHTIIHRPFYVFEMTNIIFNNLEEIYSWSNKIKALAYESCLPSDLIDVDDAFNFFEERKANLFGLESGFFKLCRNDKYLNSIKHKLEEIVFKSDKEYASKHDDKKTEGLAGKLGSWLNKNL